MYFSIKSYSSKVVKKCNSTNHILVIVGWFGFLREGYFNLACLFAKIDFEMVQYLDYNVIVITVWDILNLNTEYLKYY